MNKLICGCMFCIFAFIVVIVVHIIAVNAMNSLSVIYTSLGRYGTSIKVTGGKIPLIMAALLFLIGIALIFKK